MRLAMPFTASSAPPLLQPIASFASAPTLQTLPYSTLAYSSPSLPATLLHTTAALLLTSLPKQRAVSSGRQLAYCLLRAALYYLTLRFLHTELYNRPTTHSPATYKPVLLRLVGATFEEFEGGEVCVVRRQGVGVYDDAVLVHGFGASSLSYHTLPALAATTHAYDAPGFGFTAPPPTASYHAVSVAAGLACLGTGRSVVVGHSMGAVAAMDVAEQKKCDLVLISPALMKGNVERETTRRWIPGVVTRALWSCFKPFFKVLLRRLVSRESFWVKGLAIAFPQVTPEVVSRYRMPGFRRGWEEGVLEFCRQSGGTWSLAKWSSVTAKRRVLVIHGAEDEVVKAENSRWLEGLGRCEVVVMAGVGHVAHEERPDEVAEIVREWAERGSVR